jgi:hypothetical protein
MCAPGERLCHRAADKRDYLASSHSAPRRQAVGDAIAFRATGPRIAHSAGVLRREISTRLTAASGHSRRFGDVRVMPVYSTLLSASPQ